MIQRITGIISMLNFFHTTRLYSFWIHVRKPRHNERHSSKYIENGGGWIGFHFAGFALNDSEFPKTGIGITTHFSESGEFKSNTWRPTSAILRVEGKHPVTKHMPPTFKSAPSEWYRWNNDLRANKDIKILLSIDPSSFPLGTGPKPDEIWHEGYYPVVVDKSKITTCCM